MVELIKVAYSVSGLVAVSSYLPQIYKLIKDIKNAEGLSLYTWLGWSLTSIVSLLYGVLVLKDTLFICYALGNTFGCGTISILWHKYRNKV